MRLDAVQREALRQQIALDAQLVEGGELAVVHGDRDVLVRARDQLARLIAALDAIGWKERLDEPDRQPVRDPDALRAYAVEAADRVGRALRDLAEDRDPDHQDQDLLTLAVLRRAAEAS
jgi:hypothetical protein